MIDRAIKDRTQKEKEDPLYQEVIQHTLFCQSKVRAFYGRQEVLKVLSFLIFL